MENIPEQFHSFETDEPFTNCCDCSCELIKSAQMYMVQKNFEGSECIMEYALCHSCKEKLDEQISAESKESLFDFLFVHTEMIDMPDDHTAEDALKQIDECLTCGKERLKCKAHSYSGLFVGSILVPGPMPMMICDDCQETIAENLSEHTKDVKDKFYEENFPGPPANIGLPHKGKPMFL